jgi:pyruvate/2-oxoacid:ferredoxin oxidoreductase beta subunit
MKELKEELLAPGHRACPGCGEILAIRYLLKALGPKVVVASATGCMEVVTTPYPETSWRVPWIHVAFENAAAVASGIEVALRLQKKDDIKVVAIAGDGGTADIGFQALSGIAERGHNVLYMCTDNEAYMNCLDPSTLVLTEKGLKTVSEVEVGELLYSFDPQTQTLVARRCSGVFFNGVHDIYEVITPHHIIRATPNHPFLVLERGGRAGRNRLVWKTLNQLRMGDEVVVLKKIPYGESYRFHFKPVRVGDPKVTHLNPVRVPRQSSPELMKFLGIWVGDGWVRSGRGEVGFALPEGKKGRRELVDLSRKVLGTEPAGDDTYLYLHSVNLARFIDSLGFGRGAKNKTIPGWIFTLPLEQREAFLEGLMLSDGYGTGGSYRYVSASRDLLRRLRLLLQTLDYRVGKIHWQERKKGEKCVERRLLKDTGFGYVCFSRKRRPDVEKYPSQCRYRNYLAGNEFFEMERIAEIRYVGRNQTVDLRVEKNHNFIADGMVVHNTGIQRSGTTPRFAWTTTTPVGKAGRGKPEWKKDMVSIMVAHGIPYAATACVSFPDDFLAKVRKAASIKGPTYLHVLCPCPTGWRFDSGKTIEVGRLAVMTGMWVLYEVENGRKRLTFRPERRLPVSEYLKAQGRFRHLTEAEIAELQRFVDESCKEWGI